jgi:hypothetical protein
VHPVEAAHRRKWIDDGEHQALAYFVGLMGAARAEPRTTQNLTGSRAGGSSEDRVLLKMAASRKLYEAVNAIKSRHRSEFMDWMEKAEYTDIGVADFGKTLTPLAHVEARKAVAIEVLRSIAGDLKFFFKIR